MPQFFDWLGKQPQQVVTILSIIFGGLMTIIVGLFTVILWPLLRSSGGQLWDKAAAFVTGRAFENRYLDWLIKEHQFLPILPTTLVPVTERHHQELDKLYVALTLTRDHEQTQEVTLGDALRNAPKLVILGDPGAGKTTMLRFLALTFARARRGRSPAAGRSELKQARESVKAARTRLSCEFGFSARPMPILVYLNRLRDIGTWPKDRSLLDALRDEMKSVDTLRDFPRTFFDKKLSRGECTFLFDAFDELGTQEARDSVARKIGELASAAPTGNRFIVTSRIVGYSGQLARHGFEAITVERLSWALIEQLVTKWYATLNEPTLAAQLLDTLRLNSRIYDLALNPMLLSLIVLVQYVKRLIPDRRHILYEECVKILVERRYAPPYVQEAYNGSLPGEEAVSILRELAKYLQDAHLREISRHELERQVLPELLKSMPTSRAASVPCSEILKNIEQRSQLLIERGLSEAGNPVMAFSHLTFQEYLASVALKELTGKRGEGAVSASLIDLYESDPEWWEEVALLYAAQLSGLEQQSFLTRIYPKENGGKSKP